MLTSKQNNETAIHQQIIPHDLTAEIKILAEKLYPLSKSKNEMARQVLADYYLKALTAEILVVHRPGGWGNTSWDGVQDWEKSIVTGVTSSLERFGYNIAMVQYFRSGDGIWRHIRDLPRQMRFFITGSNHKADAMKEKLTFILRKLPDLRIVLVGASQGAAFNNAVMIRIPEAVKDRIYSLELGTFFPYMKHRQLSSQNLAIDSNGLMPDPMCQRNLRAGFKAYFSAFYRWFRHKLRGENVKFTNCINTPGHEYKWEYEAVNVPIVNFLSEKLGVKQTS